MDEKDSALIRETVDLAPWTTWKVGGPADFFALPKTTYELQEALNWARAQMIPVAVIGRGSNLWVSDKGFRGLVICLKDFNREPEFSIVSKNNDNLIHSIKVSAGVSLPRLAKVAASLGWLGYEFLIGIPGTVGGALYMNTGYKRGEKEDMAHLCDSVTWINSEGIVMKNNYNELHPSYRYSDFQEMAGSPVLIEAEFHSIGWGDRLQIREATAHHLAMRKRMQPLSAKTAGSVFKGHDDGTPAAVFIDQAGLKGFQIGGARVSPKHANWIENHDHATAQDIEDLIQAIIERVHQKFQITLHAEIQRLKE